MTATDAGTRFTHHAATDVGRNRKGNEDDFYEGELVFAVADGMGGHAAGEVASNAALKPVRAVDGRTWPTGAQAERALADAVRAANHDVVSMAAADRKLRGMGTTLTAVLVRDGRLHVAHVGDSRAYLLRPDEGMRQLTTDHTLVEQLVREGRLRPEEIAEHPQRSVITRAIGVEPSVQVDTLPAIELRPGDQVLLCSDGLSGPVEDDEIALLLIRTLDGDEACRALIDAANRAGGPDNITVVLLRVEEAPPGEVAGRLDAPTARLPAGGDTPGEDTAELRPTARGEQVHHINTRQEASGTFDAGRLGALGRPQGVEGPPVQPTPAPRRSRRVLAAVLSALVLLGVVAGGGYLVLSRSYFIGVDDGQVAIFTGLPQDLAGIPLHSVTERTDLAVADLPSFRQARLESGITEPSLGDARATVDDYRAQLEAEAREETAPQTPPPTTAPPADPNAPPAVPAG